MLTNNVKDRPRLVLLERETFRFLLIPSTKEETELLQAILTGKTDDKIVHHFDFLNDPEISVDMVGEVNEVQPNHVYNIIPKLKQHRIRKIEHIAREEVINEYYCYQQHKIVSKNNNIVKHEEQVSSFKCACQLMQTEYFIVLKETKKKDDGDKNRDTTTHTKNTDSK